MRITLVAAGMFLNFQSPMGKVKYISREDIMETYQSPMGKVKLTNDPYAELGVSSYQFPMGKVKLNYSM